MDLELLGRVARWAHILAGATSLLTGLIALLSKKGARAHRLAGRVFLYAMIGIAVTAIILALLRPNPFLFYLGLLSVYLALWGRVALARKRVAPEAASPRVYLLAPASLGLVALGFLVKALSSGAIIFIVFAALGLTLANSHRRELMSASPYKLHWLIQHQTGFTTAYIASLTAFLVVNAGRFLPSHPAITIAVWLGPTLVGVPLIIRATGRFKREDKRQPADGAHES